MKPSVLIVSALLCTGAASPVFAQEAYKCWSNGSVVYSQKPCSGRVVNTDQAPVPVKPNTNKADVRRMEQNRAIARSLRQKPGETGEQFETRRRRALMAETDRDECARLDTRMPVDEARMKAPDSVEVKKAEASLVESKQRFSELRC